MRLLPSMLKLRQDFSSQTILTPLITEVRVFLNSNSSKLYFKIDETSKAVEITSNVTEATFFTLKTTPDLHKSGYFQLVHAAGNESTTPTSSIQDGQLILKLDTERPVTRSGPYKVVPYSEECRNSVHLEIQGMSTTLPELQH